MDWPPNIEISNEEMHRFFLKEVYRKAYSDSNDPVSKIGSGIVRHEGDTYRMISLGVNVITSAKAERWSLEDEIEFNKNMNDRQWKMDRVMHAEPNAIGMAREFFSQDLQGSIMYMPWVPCDECAKAIKESGIKTLISHNQFIERTPERWYESLVRAIQYLKENNIKHQMYDGKIGDVFSVFNGQVWSP